MRETFLGNQEVSAMVMAAMGEPVLKRHKSIMQKLLRYGISEFEGGRWWLTPSGYRILEWSYECYKQKVS